MGALGILARAEYQEGLRNRWVLAAIAILATLAFALALLGSTPIGETRASPMSVTAVSLASLSIYLIPLIALTLSFDAIIGEQERGSLLLLLTYPVTRWQLIAGKFCGHLAILTSAIVLGYGSAGLYIGLHSAADAEGWRLFASMMASSLLLGAVFVSLGYLVSVLVSARATAVGMVMALWLFIVVLYDLLLLGVLLADKEHGLSSSLLGSLILFNPADAYRLFNLAGSEAASMVSGTAGLLEDSMLEPWMLVGVLLLWVIVPLAIALLIFQRREL
jgi:Cu-processing system permease protein